MSDARYIDKTMLDAGLKTEIDDKLSKDSPVDWNQITNKPTNGYATGRTPPTDKNLLWVDTSS